MGEFDGLHVWLGVSPAEQPPNHYRLLGIPLFESNADVIDNAAESRQLKLKSVQNGPHAKLSQQLLNDVTAAQACLLNAEQKAKYDAQLKRETEDVVASSGAPEAPIIVADAGPTATRAIGQRPKKKSAASPGSLMVKLLSAGAAILVIAAMLLVYSVLSTENGAEPDSDADDLVAVVSPPSDKLENAEPSETGASTKSSDAPLPSNAASEKAPSPETATADETGAAPNGDSSDASTGAGVDKIDTVELPGAPATGKDQPDEAVTPDREEPSNDPPPTVPPPNSNVQPSTTPTNDSVVKPTPPKEQESPPLQLDSADRKKLDRGIRKFKDDIEKHQRSVRNLFDKSEATARRLGNKPVLEQLAEERWRFETLGELKDGKDEAAAALETEFQSVLRGAWNELLINSSLEAPAVNNQIPGWRIVSGAWAARKPGWPAVHGDYYVWPGPVLHGELVQDVDVSPLVSQIEKGDVDFQFRAHLRTYVQMPPDTCRVVVEFLDSAKQTLDGGFDSGPRSPIKVWERVEEKLTPPPETRFVRIRLISHRNGRGTRNNDASYDLLSLTSLPSKP